MSKKLEGKITVVTGGTEGMADITELERVKFVMKGGVVYKNEIH